MPKVVITGVSGYLGKALCQTFLRHNWQVVGLSRNPAPDLQDPNYEWRRWELGAPLPTGALDLDCAILAAYDYSCRATEASWARNVEGSLLFAASVPPQSKLIYISSIAAQDGARQQYAQQKLAVERGIRHRGLSVRPGLIVSDPPGGMVAKLANLPHLPILPVPAARAQQYLVELDFLCERLFQIASGTNATGEVITIVSSGPITFANLLQDRLPGLKLPLAIPWRPVWAMLWAMEKIGLRPPLSSDSLLGLATTKYPHIAVSGDISPAQLPLVEESSHTL